MKKWIMPCLVVMVLTWLVVLSVQAGPLGRRSASAPAPQAAMGTQIPTGSAFTYQGQLKSGGAPVTADCEMAFRLYDDAVVGSQVGSPISTTVPITDGLFTVELDFGSDAFGGDARWLGLQVQCPGDSGYADLGRQALTAVPYALYAARSGGPENVITVARSGGDYTSVRAALDSIDDASADNPYLVWVGPGVYHEAVALKPYVHLQGAGQDSTILTSEVSADWPLVTATLVLTANSSVRDLTVENSASADMGLAILATDGSTQTLVADVTARTWNRGSSPDQNMAICLTGDGTHVTLLDVTTLAEGGGQNYGLHITVDAQATLQGGVFRAQGGSRALGISTYGAGRIRAYNVFAQGENSDYNYGLSNTHTEAVLHGGSFTARGGSYAYGIFNTDSTAVMDARDVIALAEGGDENYGLQINQGAHTTLSGGSFTGRGGSITYGIANYASASRLVAAGVLVLGEDGSSENRGLINYSARTTLYGGSFTARGGNYAYGLHNRGTTAYLFAENAAALGEGGGQNTGLYNEEGGDTLLRGGSFTGRGGSTARGIYSYNDNSYLEAERVSALGEDGSSNRGLESSVGADVVITESVMEGADASMMTSGGGGPITASNSRLVGGLATGNVSCTAMSRGTTFNASGCP